MTTADVMLLVALLLVFAALGLSTWSGVKSLVWPLLVAIVVGLAAAALVVQSTVVRA